SERDWDDFMGWADSRGSNASAEINRFIKQSLGRIDSDIQPVNTGENVNTVWVTKEDLEKAIADLAIPSELNPNDPNSQFSQSLKAITDLSSQFSKLRGEVDDLKKSEPIE
ncbi:MAG: hypothetical protein ACKO5Q_24605, partial [Microcystaceae cyanobacterium]